MVGHCDFNKKPGCQLLTLTSTDDFGFVKSNVKFKLFALIQSIIHYDFEVFFKVNFLGVNNAQVMCILIILTF